MSILGDRAAQKRRNGRQGGGAGDSWKRDWLSMTARTCQNKYAAHFSCLTCILLVSLPPIAYHRGAP
jgi:hypothetical protein